MKRRSRRPQSNVWERVVTRALLSPDPVAAFQSASRDPELPPTLRRALSAASTQPDGIRMTALLVVKLRFERLLRGSQEAASWFERDARGFADAFKRYHSEVAPTAFFPSDEAALFDEWAGITR